MMFHHCLSPGRVDCDASSDSHPKGGDSIARRCPTGIVRAHPSAVFKFVFGEVNVKEGWKEREVSEVDEE